MKDFGVQAAVDGVGVAFASQQLIARHIAEGRLVALLETWSAPFPGYYLCYPAQRQMAPPLRAVIDTIRAGPRLSNGVLFTAGSFGDFGQASRR